ncbi:phosphoribosylformylglycinamidine synthase subunit PurL [Thermogemmatispora tikiterensis]|uniref:phosphoribosylformylglycinamidine synthase subunit PurL n=1 Tax=Thermogemmatispora tikiterensis TaxID=1825093 RepID=UPI001CB940A7|nr:phosphoribosylformylglycinamidine synthase subunit PurL [Thermogemmatispora tikiterensis]
MGRSTVTDYHIEVRATSPQYDIPAQQLARELSFLSRARLPALAALGESLPSLFLRTAQLYSLSGTCSPEEITRLARELLIDPVTQTFSLLPSAGRSSSGATGHIIDVFFLPGVTDTLAESVLLAASLLGIAGLERVATGRRYFLDERLSRQDVRAIAEALLYNPVIQFYRLLPAEGERAAGSSGRSAPRLSLAGPAPSPSSPPHVARLALSEMNVEELSNLSRQRMLALTVEEMQAIQEYFRRQGRAPTDVELETLAQTWSEHCSHKTFKATVVYRELTPAGETAIEETIPGLLRSFIMQATSELARPWVVSAFSDNAGLVQFTDGYDLAFKVETHNHPSAIEPFGGANTGVGGVIRDVLGVSARPIACTDVLCFGPPDTPVEELPPGVLAPRRVASGVVNGVRDYGNKMGIPTVNGAVLYHREYLCNPLVFCGCLGLLPHGSHPRAVEPGDLVVVLGGRTGRDGIHGATFSSGEMSSETQAVAGSAVQIGAPITEKKVTDVVLQARERRLYHAITDCGAGGFSSAIGEMGAQTGVRVDLARAPLKYQGLAPWEVWLSEAQERMVLAVPPACLDELLELCALEEVEATVLGEFTADGRLTVTWGKEVVADLEMAFLHEGRPQRTLEALWQRRPLTVGSATASPEALPDAADVLLTLLRHPTIGSKEGVVRRYDHEVQGATVRKPLVGRAGNGPGDGAVLQPLLEDLSAPRAGVVLTNGINPLYGKIDPYHMALNAVDEALRNLTALGGDIERAALLDNFCWGNPADPEQLGMLVRAVRGCYDAALGFGTPFISGKDSLNNEYRFGERRLPVIPTLLISALGVIEDASRTVDMALKAAGNLLYVVGLTRNELAASHYAEVVGPELLPTTALPQVELEQARTTMKALGEAIRRGLVQSCHDLSEGGLAVAAAEMALAGLLGVSLDLARQPATGLEELAEGFRPAVLLFSESPSRFLVEVAPSQREAFEAHMRAGGVTALAALGHVTASGRFVIKHGAETLIDLSIAELQAAWKGELP